jgi:hypothetical protein
MGQSPLVANTRKLIKKSTRRLWNPKVHYWPITVAARSKPWTVFARSNTGIMGLNPTQGMDVCVHLIWKSAKV